MKWIANFLKKGMIKIPGRGCKITQRTANPEGQKSAGVKSFAQIKKDLKPYMGQ